MMRYMGFIPGGGGPCLAVFTTFFGERLDSFDPPSGDPLTERESFDSYLTGVTVEDWEDETVADSLTTVSSSHGGGLTATWTRDDGTPTHIFFTGGNDMAIDDSEVNGRFNTTTSGANFFESGRPVIIEPSVSIAAWGAYFTDVGDFNRQMTIELTDDDDNVTTYDPAHTSGGLVTSLLFWGFIDPTGTLYKKIKISMSGDFTAGSGTVEDPDFTTFNDFFGIDDVLAATLDQVSVC